MSLSDIPLPDRATPLVIHWPMTGRADGFVEFAKADAWRSFVAAFSLDPHIPDLVRLKFERGQKLYLLGWIDADLIKAGELVVLTALELALNDRYGQIVQPAERKRADPAKFLAIQPPRRSFKALLNHMVVGDGLTDADLPMIVKCGGTAVGQLTGTTQPSLADRRNALAHGHPFDGLPTSGLIELVRDLIMYAYRHFLQEARGIPVSVHQPVRGDG